MSFPKNVKDIFALIKSEHIKFVDFRFTDLKGQWHHITITTAMLEENTFKEGLNFDGSSIEGWCPIHRSDMFYLPDPTTAFIDPFTSHATLVILCDIIDAATNAIYNRCPRGVATRAEAYLKASGIADKAMVGPELEFFIFDNVAFSSTMNESFYHIDAAHGAWNTGSMLESGSTGHLAGQKGGYFKVSPIDRFQDMRSEMLETFDKLGMEPRLHHPEVGTAGQSELGIDADTPKRMADKMQMYKYVVKNVADLYGKTATFMPKPLAGDNGSGMHVHQSLWKKNKPLFAGTEYNGLSQEALYYIGGIIKHAKALNAFTNPSTNSYKRLVPGYEAPVILTYAGRNRSAAIRIPASNGANSKRIETRFPDPTANGYLALSALIMAGLDGIKNKIDPGAAMEENLYELSPEEEAQIPQVCGSLNEALVALDADRAFLTEGGVFDDDMIDSYIDLKIADIERLEQTPSPVEFEMYYSC